MNHNSKARVGLLGLMFDLYDALPELKPMMAGFAGRLVEGSGGSQPVCDRRRRPKKAAVGAKTGVADPLRA